MKELFPGYYRPTQQAFQKLWEDCLFAVDANVLLNIYGYSKETRNELIRLLESISPRLVIPYQFAMEYQRNRVHAIMEQVKNYAKVEKTLSDIFKQELEPKHKHPYLSKESLKAFKKIQAELEKARRRHEELFSHDRYAERIATLLKQVGPKPADLGALCEAAKKRYASKIPPGFADEKNKPEPDRYGDCIGWLQIIEIAKGANKPVILITDDSKEDWWHIEGDRTIGPHPFLVAEFQEKAGQNFYMYSANRFMELSGEYLDKIVPKLAIEEVQTSWEERVRANLHRTLKRESISYGNADEKPYVAPDPKPTALPDSQKPIQGTTEDKKLPDHPDTASPNPC